MAQAKKNGAFKAFDWLPIEDAPCPYGPCLLRLGPKKCVIGFCDFNAWHELPDMRPIEPTHYQDFPD